MQFFTEDFFLLLKQRFRSESLKGIYRRWSQSRFQRERPQHDFIYRHNTAIPFELLIRCSRAFPAFALAVPSKPTKIAPHSRSRELLDHRPSATFPHSLVFLSFSEPKQVSLVLIYYLHPQFPLCRTPNWNNDITSLKAEPEGDGWSSKGTDKVCVVEATQTLMSYFWRPTGGDEERLQGASAAGAAIVAESSIFSREEGKNVLFSPNVLFHLCARM